MPLRAVCTSDYPPVFRTTWLSGYCYRLWPKACLFIIVRALVPQIGMPSVAIVPSLDPSKDVLYCGPSGFVCHPINQLLFQCSKEALHRRIVPTISFPTHTLNKLVVSQLFLECITRELRTPVAMHQKARCCLALIDCHSECSRCNRCIECALKAPTNDPTRVQIHHN